MPNSNHISQEKLIQINTPELPLKSKDETENSISFEKTNNKNKKDAKEINDTKPQRLFLQIDRKNLLFFLSTGIFFSKNYCDKFNYIFKDSDLFSLLKNQIVLTSNFYSNYKDNVLVELCLENIKKDSLKIEDNTNLYIVSEIIPVSRIKNIYFSNEEKKSEFINSMFENSPTYKDICIVDKELFSHNTSLDLEKFETQEISFNKRTSNVTVWQIDRFISILGMIKMMSLSDYMSWQFKKGFSFPSNEALGLLSMLNSKVYGKNNFNSKNENLYKIFINNNTKEINSINEYVLNYLIEYMDQNIRFEKKLISSLKESIDSFVKNNDISSLEAKEVNEIFKDLENWVREAPGITYDKITEKEIFSKNWSFLLLLILTKYSNKDKIREVFKALTTINRIAKNHDTIWKVLAGLGRYFGYKNLINSLIFEQDEKIIEEIIGNKIRIKSENLNVFERKLIESLYLYIKKQEFISDDLNYLEKITTKDKKSIKTEIRYKDIKEYAIEDNSFSLLDIEVINLVIRNRIDNLEIIIKNHYPEEIEIWESMLAFILIKNSLINYKSSKSKAYINKDELLTLLKEETRKFNKNIAELEVGLSFDKNYGYIK
jgi:hypothetical protein